MSKYDIHKNNELPSDEEINKYKNFDKVVKKAAMLDYKQATKPIYKNANVLSAVAVIIAVGLIILFETTEQNDASEKVTEQKADSLKSNSPVQKSDSIKPAKPTSVTLPVESAVSSQAANAGTTEQQITAAEHVHSTVENTGTANTHTLAGFPGGDEALKSFLLNTIKYPYNAVESPYTGKIEVDLLIEKSGEIANITIYHSPNAAISNEIKRVIGNMPKWEPSVKNGQKIPSTVSVYFPFTYVGE